VVTKRDNTRDDRAEGPDIESVLRELTAIRNEMTAAAGRSRKRLAGVHPNYADSAANLLHYLALRRRDLRPLQQRLAALGLSSLGRAESHVLATVDAVLGVLRHLVSPWEPTDALVPARVDFAAGQRLLAEHTDTLLGPAPAGRRVRIMVTMPSEAADDYTLVRDLVRQGMNCMRINCAHDEPAAWLRMIEHLRRAEKSARRQCRVVMDLAGPKLRTGPMQPGPAVVRIRPLRDARGAVTAPARAWLTSAGAPFAAPSLADAVLPVDAEWLARLRLDETVHLRDARGSRRRLRIADITEHGAWAEVERTTYVVPGTVLAREGRAGAGRFRETAVGDVPPIETAIPLTLGDRLILTRTLKPGRAAVRDRAGAVLTPASIGVTIPEVFDDIRSGQPVWFDDGKIGGVIEKVERGRAFVRITHARARGERLRADKGINFPETNLRLQSLTTRDLDDLAFVARHADVVEMSFANAARDVELLQEHLARLGTGQPAIVLKIETQRGFANLPDMLLTAMRSPCCGVMIARGDLAVECGFERLAEVQEEILWICEAAHVPVIWATQVLETLAKEGLPSRAEITDAAMGDRAECVMLNKGPHVVSAVRVLDDILRRMQAHQTKKQAMLRELQLAHAITSGPAIAAVPPAPVAAG
jgi:pyruvate kinase